MDHAARRNDPSSSSGISLPPSPIGLESPSASAFLRTAATLEGLARQLDDLKEEQDDGEADVEVRCTCGAFVTERDKLEDKLKLSGEIGQALLQRYEALEKKLQREVEKYEHQLNVKRTALAESVRRMNNLERANGTHMQKFADMSKKSEALEKRYTQALHTQTLTQASLTHVRAELTSLRAMSNRQGMALASGLDVEERLAEVERRYEEAREMGEVEGRRARDEARKRKRAEARIVELEGQLAIRTKEVEEVKEGRAKDAHDLLANAKERLAILHSELSETFRAESPADAPEYQRTLEDLVASNALLKHDASELDRLLSDSREETRVLRDEIDELRSVVGVAPRISPPKRYRPLSIELSHSRTGSSPIVGNFSERQGWSRMSVASSSRAIWDHQRKSSLAPSFASTSTNEGGLASPGLGMGPIGEFGGALVKSDSESVSVGGALSPTLVDGRESPKPVFRTSPSGGIAYVLNGVPKTRTGRPSMGRSFSSDKRASMRSFSTIAEWPNTTEHPTPEPETPNSPGSTEYFRSAEAARKRRSILLTQAVTSPQAVDTSPNANVNQVDQATSAGMISPMSDSVVALQDPPRDKRVNRRTLLLLSRSMGVQTDPVGDMGTQTEVREEGPSIVTSPRPTADSESSSIHESRPGVLSLLVEHLSKILGRLRSADVPTLNKRLRKQHLAAGDVGHLSRSTLRTLQQEIADLRTVFRGSAVDGSTTITRREMTSLIKLMKDVFGDLVDLQAVINDITIEPRLAKKLQKEAYRDEVESPDIKQASGLGWIAAPITKFFVTPASELEVTIHPGKNERGRLQPTPVRPAPKLSASTSATTTHVSVEFGGSGMVRRATPAVQPVNEALPPSPNGMGGEEGYPQTMSRSTSVTAGGETHLQPHPHGTLRPSKSRANRNELLGIFAGASTTRPQISPTGGGNWVVLPTDTSSRPIPNRSSSSQYYTDQTIRPKRQAADRKRLSTVVDAVIDDTDPNNDITFDNPPLLERQLRPRGLSDSSIRSTFVSHGAGGGGNPGMGMISAQNVTSGPVTRVVLGSTGVGGGVDAGGAGNGKKGYLESLANRFYTFRGSIPQDVSPVNPEGRYNKVDGGGLVASADANTAVMANPSSGTNEVSNLVHSKSPAKPIPGRSASKASVERVVSPGSMSESQGLLGRLAGSLIGDGSGGVLGKVEREERGDEHEESELAGAALRQNVVLSRGGGGKSWR